MKKLKLLYAVLFAVAIIACSKDDESPTFKKEDFVGIWKEDGTEDNGCVDVVKFDATKLFTYGEKCGTQDAEFFFDGAVFTFDGKSFKITDSGIEEKYVIVSKTATTFKADYYISNTKFSTSSYTKVQ
jgi:hypothetical protein